MLIFTIIRLVLHLILGIIIIIIIIIILGIIIIIILIMKIIMVIIVVLIIINNIKYNNINDMNININIHGDTRYLQHTCKQQRRTNEQKQLQCI